MYEKQFINLGLAVLTSVICLAIEFFRNSMFGNLENGLIVKLENGVVAIFNSIKNRLKKEVLHD